MTVSILRVLIAMIFLTRAPSILAEDFSIVVLPDLHADIIGGAGASIGWVAGNYQQKNIALLIQLGDWLTYDTASSWSATDSAWSPLKNKIGTATDPFTNMATSFCLGNHDYESLKTRSSKWKSRFGTAIWKNYSWFLGASPNGECSAVRFTKDGYTFISIAIEYDVMGTGGDSRFKNQQSIDWIKSILDANPNCPTMLSTHSYLYDVLINNQISYTREGAGLAPIICGYEAIENGVKVFHPGYKQIFMINSGHVCGTSNVEGTGARNRLVDRSRAGQAPVQEMVTDYQNFGIRRHYVRLLEFSGTPSNKTISASTFRSSTGSQLTSSRNHFSWTIDLSRYSQSIDAPPVDVTPPAHITLSTGSVTPSSVSLSWNAPGDDGVVGTATSYDVRYSQSPITPANFSSATAATSGKPVPGAPGIIQTMTIGNLSASTVYYFAITAQDDSGNVSVLSNVPTATTRDSIVSTEPIFMIGVNLNGPAVTIEGNTWLSFTDAKKNGMSITSVSTTSPPKYFSATTLITPVPTTDAATKTMLNSAVYAATTFTINQTIANGNYAVYLWTMENYLRNSRSFDVRIENSVVATGIGQLAKDSWKKYGPYAASVSDNSLTIQCTSTLGNPGVMGIALYNTTPAPAIGALFFNNLFMGFWTTTSR